MSARHAGLEFREVESSDGERIGEFLAEIPTPGPIEVGSRYRPLFWDTFAGEGEFPKGVIVLSKGTLVGVGLITRRKLWVKGKVTEVGYLNSLCISPEFRNGFVIARGFNLLRKIHQHELGLPIYITSIMRGNKIASKTLLGGRAGLPEYRLLSSYKTFALPTWNKKCSLGGGKVLLGSDAGMDAVLYCLETFGKQNDLFPVIVAECILGNNGLLRGPCLDNFLVAYSAGEPVGVAAVWDQSTFKNLCVVGYNGFMKPVEQVSNMMARVTGRRIVPRSGATISPVYLSNLAIKDNDASIFSSLLDVSLAYARHRKNNWLIAGFFTGDPLIQALRRKFKFTFDSDIYTVHWDNGSSESINPDAGKYLDVGSL